MNITLLQHQGAARWIAVDLVDHEANFASDGASEAAGEFIEMGAVENLQRHALQHHHRDEYDQQGTPEQPARQQLAQKPLRLQRAETDFHAPGFST